MRSQLGLALLLTACSSGGGAAGPMGGAGPAGGNGATTNGGVTDSGGSANANGAGNANNSGGTSAVGGAGGANASAGSSGSPTQPNGGTTSTVVDWNPALPAPPSAPEIQLIFPTFGATQAAELTVHGSAYQAKTISVNGAPATLTPGAGDASTWSAPHHALSMGDNVITITGTDKDDKALPPVTVTVARAAGTSGALPTSFTRGSGYPPPGTILFGLALSNDAKYLYASQGGTKGLYRVELSTGNAFETDAFAGSSLNKTGVSDPTTSDVALVENGKYMPRLFGPDGGNALRYTDTQSYQFYSFWSAPEQAHLYNVAYHARNDRLVLSVIDDQNTGDVRIVSIDPSDPASVEVLADKPLGLKNFSTTLLDESSQRFYYATYYDDSGSINFVSLSQPAKKGSLPKGKTETAPQQIDELAMCPGSSVLYVLEEKGGAAGWNRISTVDVSSGDRHTLVDSPTTGSGVPLINTRKLICAHGTLYGSLGQSFEAMDAGCAKGACPENKLISIDPLTGDRLVVSFFSSDTQAQVPGH